MTYITSKQVSASIKAIDAKKLRATIQTATVNVMVHAMAFGSSPLADDLIERMGTVPMLKRLAPLVSSMLTERGPFSYTKGVGYAFSKKKAEKIAESFGIRENFDAEGYSESLPAFDDQPKAGAAAKSFDLFKELESLIKRAEGKVAKGECMTASLIPYLKAAAGQHAAHVLMAKAAAPAADDSNETARKFAAEILAAEKAAVAA